MNKFLFRDLKYDNAQKIINVLLIKDLALGDGQNLSNLQKINILLVRAPKDQYQTWLLASLPGT